MQNMFLNYFKEICMPFSPSNFTFDDFSNISENVVNQFNFIAEYECLVEDSIPWLNIYGNKSITPKNALKILNELQLNIKDEVLFNSLQGKTLKIVVNGKFHFTPQEQKDFDEEYAYDFGQRINEFKEEYNL